MPGRIQEEVLRGLDALIEQGRGVVASYDSDDTDDFHERQRARRQRSEHDIRAFVAAGSAEVVRVAGRESEYFRQLPLPVTDGRSLTAWEEVPANTLGVLIALRGAVANGHLEQLAVRVRAAVQDDMLQQAEDLLTAGYHQAALVLVAGVLENRMRQLCDARGLQPAGRTLNAYNQALRDVYDQPTWRRIQVVADLRNEVAHGHFDQVRREQVVEELAFVRRFLVDYPA